MIIALTPISVQNLATVVGGFSAGIVDADVATECRVQVESPE